MQHFRNKMAEVFGTNPNSNFMNELIIELAKKQPRVYEPTEQLPIVKQAVDWDRWARDNCDMY